MPASDAIAAALDQLNTLSADVSRFAEVVAPAARYSAPIIDWLHPAAYEHSQPGITGLRKFAAGVEVERGYVEGLATSLIPPKGELTTNAPNTLAVWHEFVRAPWPLVAIGQTVELPLKEGEVPTPITGGRKGRKGRGRGQRKGIGKNRGGGPTVKVDVICAGGDEWVKVNTARIKEARLLAEFREQDSYINSDYDSDDSNDHDDTTTTQTTATATITNSLISQARTLLAAASAARPLPGRGPPRVRLVLPRLTRPEGGYSDDRLDETLSLIESIGVQVQLGLSLSSPIEPRPPLALAPTRNVILDLSVLVALCCDSTHHPLPTSEAEHESRFCALRIVPNTQDAPNRESVQGVDENAAIGVPPAHRVELGPHSSASKDLYDQLGWEMRHPLMAELQTRLAPHDGKIALWVSQEVKDRLPGLVGVIGGPGEQARADALFATGHPKSETEEGMHSCANRDRAPRWSDRNEAFWRGSRWEGKEGVLAGIKIGVLSEGRVDAGLGDGQRATVKDGGASTFDTSLIAACTGLIALAQPTVNTDTSGRDTPAMSSGAGSGTGTGTENESVSVPAAVPSRLPSGHTLRTLIAGAERGWTVLTNNRGAVGKVCREMGVADGMGWARGEGLDASANGEARDPDGEGARRAAVWVVNPSSLSEWRRVEVARQNERIRALVGKSAPSRSSSG